MNGDNFQAMPTQRLQHRLNFVFEHRHIAPDDRHLIAAEECRPGVQAHAGVDNGAHILQPPVEIREAAAALGFDSTTLEAHGHGALKARVTRSYERFIAPGQYTFRPRNDAVRLRNVVKFTWETVPTDGGEAVSGGLEVLILDEDGRIKTDYMFPGP